MIAILSGSTATLTVSKIRRLVAECRPMTLVTLASRGYLQIG